MNTIMIKAGLLGVLLAVTSSRTALAAEDHHHTPPIEAILAEKCAEKQVKAIHRYQGCFFASLVRGRLKGYPVEKVAAINQKCTDKLISSLQQTDEKYGDFCTINASGIQQQLADHISSQVLCVVEYLFDSQNTCYP